MEDVDRDGRILTMRLPDPHGAWKAYPQDPRLLVRRDPTETGGRYYRLLTEGRMEGYDGVLIPLAPRRERLDLNRNFPLNWRQENQQQGAGPYPTSEPEVRAMVHFIMDHPNITGALPLGGGAHRVRLVVQNSGWLPSYVTKKALKKKIVRGVVCEIELPEGAILETGKVREELAQLEGRAYKQALPLRRFADPTEDRLKVEWVVRAPHGGTVRVTARHERAGVVRAAIELKGEA